MLNQDALRMLVRDVIAEEVSRIKQAKHPAAIVPTIMDSDADLVAFAQQVLRLAEDAATRADIETGRIPFRLAPRPHSAANATRQTARSHRVDNGVVTEEGVAALPAGVRCLQLGAGVSITPLARDKARSLGISVERIRR